MTKFTREDGTQNEALLSNEGIEKIKALGYKVEEKVADPFTSDAPAISPKLTIHTLDSSAGCASCQA